MRQVLHLDLPGIYVAAASELGYAAAAGPVVVHREHQVLDWAGVAGVGRGQALRVARRVAPEAAFVPADELRRAEVYRAVWDELTQVGPSVEPTALHAGFVDVTGCLPRRGVGVYLAGVGQRLAKLVGRVPTCGVGTNKLVARHASMWGEVVPAEQAVPFLQAQRLRRSAELQRPMIGTLAELGCRRWGEVAAVPEPHLYGLFGAFGTLLHRWSLAIDPRPVQSRYPPPEESVSAAVEPDEQGLWVEVIQRLAATLAQRLEQRREAAGEVVLALQVHGVWRKFRRRLSRGVWEARLLHQVALSQLPATLDPTGVDEVRLTLRNLHSREAVQLILFQDEALERRARLAAALTRVRHHYGLLSIGPVTELAGPRERLAEAVWRLEGSWS